MRAIAAGFLAGVVLCQQLTELPHTNWLWFIPLLVVLLFVFHQFVFRFLFACSLGFLWSVLWASMLLQQQLPSEWEGKDLLLVGSIASVPEKRGKGERFLFDVEQIKGEASVINLSRVRLSWYGWHPELKAGEKWQLLVRLKKPRGFMNPGGFDFEKWLFHNRIRATGYIRESDDNVLLHASDGLSLHHQRQQLRDRIQQVLSDAPYAGLISALVMGDRGGMTADQWEVLTVTGTNHLMAISGLHIGMVAGFTFALVNWLWRRREAWLKRVPAKVVGLWAAMFAALVYAAVAGFSVPTQRALLMTMVVSLCLLSRYRLLPGQILSLALLVVLLLDPLAVMNAGFWLSFFAVGGILFVTVGQIGKQSAWKQWVKIQVILLLLLAPFLIVLFQRFSLVAPLANLIAVPWVSFLVVPFALLGSLLLYVTPALGAWLVVFSERTMSWLMWFLQYARDLPNAFIWHASATAWLLVPALIGIIWLFAPRGMPVRWLGVIWLLPIFYVGGAELKPEEFEFTLLDVGQGLASIVRTQNHILVYDTGPKFSDSFNSGSAVVAPTIRQMGSSRIDLLLVSHGDNDHIGGFESLMAELDVRRILTGVPHKIDHASVEKCVAGQHWEWDGVQFQVLYPTAEKVIRKGNNGSCVLKVSNGEHNVLLTGDIERQAERILIKSSDNLRANLLVVPHHGSKTSSTRAFVQAVKPDIALLPVGYRNRYRLPNQHIMERYRESGVHLYSSADSGAIQMRFSPNTPLQINEYRLDNRKYWNSL